MFVGALPVYPLCSILVYPVGIPSSKYTSFAASTISIKVSGFDVNAKLHLAPLSIFLNVSLNVFSCSS